MICASRAWVVGRLLLVMAVSFRGRDVRRGRSNMRRALASPLKGPLVAVLDMEKRRTLSIFPSAWNRSLERWLASRNGLVAHRAPRMARRDPGMARRDPGLAR